MDSGLETGASDYVGRLTLAPAPGYSLTAKGRFDSKTFDPKVIDLVGSAKFFGLTSSLQYANYAAQPDIGYVHDRSGVNLSERFDFLDHYYINGSATVELNPYKYDVATAQYDVKTGRPAISVLGAGLGYQDDCTTLSVSYTRSYSDSVAGAATDLSVNQTVLVSLTLRTLADFKLNQSLGSTTTVQDGVFK
jgi:LPS-assembly protein